MKLTKLKFKNHPILGDLALDFKKKNEEAYQNIVFVGENGCGKTTILNEIHNYYESKYIIEKQNNNTSGEDLFRSIYIRQDIKCFSSLNAALKLISGKTLENKEIHDNVIIDELLKSNNANTNKFFEDEVAEFNNNYLKDIIKNKSISYLLKGIGGLLQINNDKPIMLIDSLSSGEQELALRLLSLKQIIKGHTDFILLDEPETALHPKWQLQIFEIINHILDILLSNERDAQLFIATHSENILKSVLKYPNTLIIRLYKNGNIICAKQISDLDRVLPYISFPEIQYIIFDIPTSDYHNALYGYLIGKSNTTEFENYIENNPLFNKDYYNNYNYSRNNRIETLPTYIRNAIHHPENNERCFTEEELRKSICFLRKLIQYKNNKN